MTQPAPTTSPTRSTRGERALDWWQRYCSLAKGDPGTRARLRRCRSATDALGERAAVTLVRQLGLAGSATAGDDQRLIAGLQLARVLAHVEAHDPTLSVMRKAGWKRFPGHRKESDAGEDRPTLSEGRFRRLLQTERGEEQVAAFVRLIALLDGSVNVAALAEDFLFWDDRTRRRWAFDYYAAGVAHPADESTSTEDPDE